MATGSNFIASDASSEVLTSASKISSLVGANRIFKIVKQGQLSIFYISFIQKSERGQLEVAVKSYLSKIPT